MPDPARTNPPIPDAARARVLAAAAIRRVAADPRRAGIRDALLRHAARMDAAARA
jgi:hypothetical protein